MESKEQVTHLLFLHWSKDSVRNLAVLKRYFSWHYGRTRVTDTLTYIATVGATVALIWFLFEKAEETISPDVKKEISNWLVTLGRRNTPFRWVNQFSAVFDSVFGENHFSWKCFRRSSLASIFAMIIMQLFWMLFDPVAARSFFQQEDFSVNVLVEMVLFFAINLIPDYLSLLETRNMLRWMSKKRLSIITLLFVDLLFTTLIALTSIMLAYYLYIVLAGGEMRIADVLYIKSRAIQFKPFYTSGYTPAVFFYTTFLTSVWIWLYVLSGLMIKGVVMLNSTWGIFLGTFDITEKPLRSLGFVSSVIAFLVLSIQPLMS